MGNLSNLLPHLLPLSYFLHNKGVSKFETPIIIYKLLIAVS